MEGLLTLWRDSGIYHMQSGQMIMIAVGVLLLFLAVRKGFEPLLLVPIGFGGILANIPGAGLAMSAVAPMPGIGILQVRGIGRGRAIGEPAIAGAPRCLGGVATTGRAMSCDPRAASAARVSSMCRPHRCADVWC